MSQEMRRKVRDQLCIQFLEAEVEAGFALVDEAKAYRASEQASFSSRVLLEATEMVADIERCLQRLAASEANPFFPLVAELRNEIAAMERESF
jgi:hypothetical protein